MFFNSLLTTPTEERTRVLLQKEFTNLGLLEIMESIRKEGGKKSAKSQEDTLSIQLKIFENEMRSAVDINFDKLTDPLEIAQVLTLQLAPSDSMYNSLVNVLQYLLIASTSANAKDEQMVKNWKSLEKIVQQAISRSDGSVEEMSEKEIKQRDQIITQSKLIAQLEAKLREMEAKLKEAASAPPVVVSAGSSGGAPPPPPPPMPGMGLFDLGF
jgi:hypothetical protein